MSIELDVCRKTRTVRLKEEIAVLGRWKDETVAAGTVIAKLDGRPAFDKIVTSAEQGENFQPVWWDFVIDGYIMRYWRKDAMMFQHWRNLGRQGWV